jgi:hypothetical protein
MMMFTLGGSITQHSVEELIVFSGPADEFQERWRRDNPYRLGEKLAIGGTDLRVRLPLPLSVSSTIRARRTADVVLQ